MNSMDRILELTAAVEQQIAGGDWLAASETDAERRRLLAAMLAGDEAGRLTESDRECLSDILRRTNAAAAEVRALKRDLLASSSGLRTGPRAMRSYRQNVEPDALTLLRD
ncbi:MAG: hypothetical protein ACE5G3_00605 [Gammaproteobacteria bacterium]